MKKLGYGSFCKVKLGIDTRNNQQVAIKILKSDISEKSMKIVQKEIDAMEKLK